MSDLHAPSPPCFLSTGTEEVTIGTECWYCCRGERDIFLFFIFLLTNISMVLSVGTAVEARERS